MNRPQQYVETVDDAAPDLWAQGIEPGRLAVMDRGITAAVEICHGLAKRAGWWTDLQTGQPKDRNPGELIALCHSELSEALEGVRKSAADSHLPHRKAVEVELADLIIRVFDMAGAWGLDLAGAMIEKLAYNAKRADHKPENRKAAGGKAF